jgi:hypothetical protein
MCIPLDPRCKSLCVARGVIRSIPRARVYVFALYCNVQVLLLPSPCTIRDGIVRRTHSLSHTLSHCLGFGYWQIITYFKKDITSGKQMCEYLGSQWRSAKFVVENDKKPDHNECFGGVGSEVISASACRPFDFSNMQHEEAPTPVAEPKDKDGKDHGGSMCLYLGSSISRVDCGVFE